MLHSSLFHLNQIRSDRTFARAVEKFTRACFWRWEWALLPWACARAQESNVMLENEGVEIFSVPCPSLRGSLLLSYQDWQAWALSTPSPGAHRAQPCHLRSCPLPGGYCYSWPLSLPPNHLFLLFPTPAPHPQPNPLKLLKILKIKAGKVG